MKAKKEQFVWQVGKKSKLPKITQWEEHKNSHGKINYSSSQGHICPKLNCEINKDPRNIELILKNFDYDKKKNFII